MNKDVEYLVMNDIHLGRNNNPIDIMVNNLDRFFNTISKQLIKLDIIYLAGDVYDQPLVNGSVESRIAISYLMRLVEFCMDNNITLYILEGTNSHDFGQVGVLDKVINTTSKFKGLKFKYIEELSIEYNEEFDINILFLPDEHNINPLTTENDIKELMVKRNIEKVDFSIMHGHFSYQLPEFIGIGHSEKFYLDITKYYIHIGHIHTHTTFKRIIAGGSVDRLKHGEEEDKGIIIASVDANGRKDYKFIVNPFAMVFNTHRINPNQTTIDIIRILKKKYKPNMFYNIWLKLSNKTNNLDKSDLKKHFPNIKFQIDIEEDKKTNEIIIKELDEVIELNSKNVVELLEKELNERGLELDENMLNILNKHI